MIHATALHVVEFVVLGLTGAPPPPLAWRQLMEAVVQTGLWPGEGQPGSVQIALWRIGGR